MAPHKPPAPGVSSPVFVTISEQRQRQVAAEARAVIEALENLALSRGLLTNAEYGLIERARQNLRIEFDLPETAPITFAAHAKNASKSEQSHA